MSAPIDNDAFEVIEFRIAVAVPIKAFLALLDSESHVTRHACYRDDRGRLVERLTMGANISDVEYGAHFGNFIFFSVESDIYTQEMRDRIMFIINDQLEWALSI